MYPFLLPELCVYVCVYTYVYIYIYIYIFAMKHFHFLDGFCVNSNFRETQLYS